METNEHIKEDFCAAYQPEDTDSTAPGLRPTPRGGWY